MIENQKVGDIDVGPIYDWEHAALQQQCTHSAVHNSFDSAEKFQEGRKNIGKISTGSKALDRMLLGGIETRALTEFYGASGSGKTQLCFTLCTIVQQNISSGGLNGKAIYIDTEQKFVPGRIVEIAGARGFDTPNILHNIRLSRPVNSLEQEKNIEDLFGIIEKDRTKLIIVDSIISRYRSDFGGRASLPERQYRLYRCMRALANIAEDYDLAVVVTNQIQTSQDSFLKDSTVPTGGNVMAHASTYRIHLRYTRYVGTAKLINSPYHPPSSVGFVIHQGGIGDDEFAGYNAKSKTQTSP